MSGPSSAQAAGSPARPATPEPDAEPPAYWREQRQGWFWYRDPAPARIQPAPPRASPAAPRASELVEFDALQRRLDTLKRIAVMNPSDANLLAYMRLQRQVMDRSQVFAQRWQRLVWQSPELDYGVSGRPTNAMAVGVFDEQQREKDAATVRALAATHGLLFLFRGDCPFCHRFAPILRRLEQAHGIKVLAVSLDGGTLPQYPDARADPALGARLQTRGVPALYLVQPSRREIRPVGFGLMSESELMERLATLAREGPPDAPGDDTPRSAR